MTLSSLIGAGTVTPVIDRRYPLNEAAAVHAPVLYLVDHGSQFVVQHRRPRVWF